MITFRERRQTAKPRITIRDLADCAGVAPLTIQKIETGNIANPGINTVSAIEKALCKLETERKKKTTA